ncbi:MAG: DUF3800 domain-containing protein [Rhodobacteraceae bacterium]|nr:DUF3800 domain-containing protein [Paracoccaceae bacterium]
MYICFVDESGTPAKPGQEKQKYFVFGGVIIPENQWKFVRQKILGLKIRKQYSGEIKWRFFAPNNNDENNPMKDWNQSQKDEFRSSVFEIICSVKSIKLICSVSDATLAYKLNGVNSQNDIYFRTFRVVTERFQYFLQDIQKITGSPTNGIIVADHRNGREDNNFRHQHDQLIRSDNSNTTNYKNVIEGIFLTPSHMSIGIQLADMIAGAVWRFYTHDDKKWFDTIKPSFRKNETGVIGGFGLACYPKRGWNGPIID